MGLLDDAIREHLELKRRRGADPAEVARAEQEALGPVRREREPAPVAEEHRDEPGLDDEIRYADEPPAAEAPEASVPHEPRYEHVEEHTRNVPPEERPEPPAAPPAPPADEPEAHEPEPESPPADPRHSDIVHQPTTEFHIDDEDEPFPPDPPSRGADDPEGPGASADEDVLEETPDFLQETPEHDRLWFEQRPPRDFDFDD